MKEGALATELACEWAGIGCVHLWSGAVCHRLVAMLTTNGHGLHGIAGIGHR